jgi:type II secretory pathway predicted ATPase ExeA
MNHAAFKKFLASTGLSTRRFGDLCGIGKSTVHRLAQPRRGGLTESYVRRITPIVMDACRRYLESAGAGAGTVHRRLTEIFGDDFKPMINHRVTLTPEVLEFFRLARDPFAAPRFPCELFTTPAIESVYARLEQAVRFQEFVCLLAPVGAGKTMLKNRLLAGLSPKSQVSKVPNEASAVNTSTRSTANVTTGAQASPLPMNAQRSKDLERGTWDLGLKNSLLLSPKFFDMSRVTAAGIVAYALEELGVRPRRALVLAQKQLEQRLAELAQNNITVALCFDECHHLNDTLLTALKNFYELGTGGFERYLGLILFGQPQFAARLELPRFREIAERLACLELPAFSPSTAENYLAHCLHNARLDTPDHGAFTYQSEGAPTSISDLGFGISDFVDVTAVKEGLASPRTRVQGPMPEVGSRKHEGQRSKIEDPKSEPGAVATGCTSPHVSKGELLNADSDDLPNPKLFTTEALRLIAARASTPLGIANAASAAMLEAYKKGERCVQARFVRNENGPKAMRVGK